MNVSMLGQTSDLISTGDQIGEFRIPGRPRTSACFCAKARLMRVTFHKEDKQT